MRFLIAAAAATTVLMSAAAAQAEKRMFIVANNSDGYGVDRCLTTGGSECGKTVANSYCHSHDFAQAVSFEKVDKDDITGAIPTTGPDACRGATCNYVAIQCSR
jgi:hypothetical protein